MRCTHLLGGLQGGTCGICTQPLPSADSMVPRGRRRRMDDWRSGATGYGIEGRDKRIGTGFRPDVLSFDACMDLWQGDDLAARAVEMLPKEALRQGYDVIINDEEDAKDRAVEVMDKLRTLGTDDYLEIVGMYERAYGGGLILLGATDGSDDLTRPLNLQRVRAFDWITPLEAREVMPLFGYTDPSAPKYGQAEIYQMISRAVLPSSTGFYGTATVKIHESRVLAFPGNRVSRYQVTAAHGGWGDPIFTRIWRVLRDFNLSWASAGTLITDFAQAVYQMKDLWASLDQEDTSSLLQARLEAMDYARSTVNATVIDADDTFSRQQTPITGLGDLLMQFATRLAAACDMPLTLLFGTSPAGLNATGESDIRQFYDRVAAYQSRKLMPHLRRLTQLAFLTTGNKTIPEKWSIKFKPLWQDSTKDTANARFLQAQADALYVTNGVASADDIAMSRFGGGEYSFETTIDFDAREDQADQMSDLADKLKKPTPALLAALGYTPPPGSAKLGPAPTVPPQGPPAAADPRTKPQPLVETEDSLARRREDDVPPDYVPPPGPGTAELGPPVSAPEGPPAAPDPNTPPQPIVEVEDEALEAIVQRAQLAGKSPAYVQRVRDFWKNVGGVGDDISIGWSPVGKTT